MEIDQKLDTALVPSILPADTPSNYKIAKWVSKVFSPPLLIILGLLMAAAAIGSVKAWVWSGFYIALVVLVPCAYILWKVHLGEISDFHMKIRAQRIKPLLLSLVCTVLAFVSMSIGQAPKMLLIFSGVGIFQLALITFITLRWKISGHSTAAAGFAVFVVALFGQIAAPILLTIPLVAWARVRLNRHEVLQTVAGSLAGIVFMWGTIALVL